jgi:hypothetical protein
MISVSIENIVEFHDVQKLPHIEEFHDVQKLPHLQIQTAPHRPWLNASWYTFLKVSQIWSVITLAHSSY